MQELNEILKKAKGLQLDSRAVTPGDVFVALSGTKTQGEKYIDEAIARGAIAVLIEKKSPLPPSCKGGRLESAPYKEGRGSMPSCNEEAVLIPPLCKRGAGGIYVVPQLAQKIGSIASQFYGYPTRDMLVIGVTGTNGKTSICYLLAQALNQAGYRTGVIGTLGMGELGHLESTGMTTPDAITLQKQFAAFKKTGINAVVMEVSSHALSQYRVDGIEFDMAIFTNLTRDHLDYHETMAHYEAAKKRLFSWPTLKAKIINADDVVGRAWLNQMKEDLTVCAYSLQIPPADLSQRGDLYIWLSNLHLSIKSIHGRIQSSWGEGELISPLLGRFNCSNLLAVLSALCMLHIPLGSALTYLKTCSGVPGRMQMVNQPGWPLTIVDYAHTPDALEQVLKTIKELDAQRIICVFGCGGDRDPGKRPIMASIAERYADCVIVTSDNPRSENPLQIINDILQGFSKKESVLIEVDRAKAIQQALEVAAEKDIVLIAGKGHETTQTIGETVYSFSDVDVARKIMARE